jgi:hypothetical protein
MPKWKEKKMTSVSFVQDPAQSWTPEHHSSTVKQHLGGFLTMDTIPPETLCCSWSLLLTCTSASSATWVSVHCHHSNQLPPFARLELTNLAPSEEFKLTQGDVSLSEWFRVVTVIPMSNTPCSPMVVYLSWPWSQTTMWFWLHSAKPMASGECSIQLLPC